MWPISPEEGERPYDARGQADLPGVDADRPSPMDAVGAGIGARSNERPNYPFLFMLRRRKLTPQRPIPEDPEHQ